MDATGLQGNYNFTVFWVQNPSVLPADAETRPSLAEAFQEQLGLKFVPKERGNVEVLLVDHAEKMPHAN